MFRGVVIFAFLAGCSGKDEPEAEYHPTLTFLSPAASATVPAGDVSVSIVVEDFELEAPEVASNGPVLPLWLLSGTALAHNEEGTPAGYCELSLDGAVVGQMSDTQFSLTAVAAGAHELVGTLFFADGDELEEPVSATVSFTAE